MNLNLHRAHIALQRRGSIELLDAAGMRIACQSGTIWVTQQLDTRDVVLTSGDSFRIERCGVTAVVAIERASLTLDECEVELARRTCIERKALSSLARQWSRMLEVFVGKPRWT